MALLGCRNISRSFGAVKALTNVSLSIEEGEVHGLVGENGAGKSTLIKIMSGTLLPTHGQLVWKDQDVILRSAAKAQQLGVETVFQELTLIPDWTVADNLVIARGIPAHGRRQSFARVYDEAKALLARFQLERIDPYQRVVDLPLPDRQMLEIVKAISGKPKLVILDEATSALLEPQVEWLFGHIRALKAQGVSVLFSSHRWSEIAGISDRISILRNGEYVDTVQSDSVDEAKVTALMTGKELNLVFPTKVDPVDDVRLSVRNLRSMRLHDISLEIRRGEVLGVGGLQGQGQLELFLSLFGALPYSGQITVDGRPVHIGRPLDAINAGIGIGLIPEDRKTEGLFLSRPILENISLPKLRRFSKDGFLQLRKERAEVQKAADLLAVKAPSVDVEVGHLSGGNQQKVMLSRWVLAGADLLLLYDVTRGVDVGTKQEIYQLIAKRAQAGAAILFYSSDTSEVVNMAHRVAVMFDYRIRSIVEGDAITMENIVGLSIGSQAEVRYETSG
ncbi:MAG: sugar ABC transporter ATP-binding protein [Sulfobacillus acidophilus]|uniref:Sugar ABC transporter ATP-binding protein n=1 Tax=Sulfobacillus acidophilus TaxID=53633 RepID=A0A2T2WDU0_9FIRM|nr:MAG: sugar ABC transporter ATP-binding protein [Sulfobacillus acidophilus]